MASQGPNISGTQANDGAGPNWLNLGNITSSNNVYSTVSFNAGSNTAYLKATNFGFSIPTGATINGIVVDIERKSSGNSGFLRIYDFAVYLVKGGSIGGNNNKFIPSWSVSDTVASYGSESDLWGLSWTDSDINSSNFGVVLKLRSDSPKGAVTASVDLITMTVYYTSGGVSSASALLLSGD